MGSHVTPNPVLEYRTDFGCVGPKKVHECPPPPSPLNRFWTRGPKKKSAPPPQCSFHGWRGFGPNGPKMCVPPPPAPIELVPYAYDRNRIVFNWDKSVSTVGRKKNTSVSYCENASSRKKYELKIVLFFSFFFFYRVEYHRGKCSSRGL